MTSEEKTTFIGIMEALALNSSVMLDADRLELYFKSLKKFNIEQVKEASKKILYSWKSPKAFPPVAVFIETLRGTKKEIEDRALREANNIISHLNQFGARKFPPLEDPVSKFLMTKRWPYHRWAADITDDGLTWWIKGFVDAYRVKSQDVSNLLLEPPERVKQLADNLFKKID